MKFITLLIILIASFTVVNAQKGFFTSESEFIFGFSNATYNNYEGVPNKSKSVSGPMRFTLWFHSTIVYNYHFSKHFGFYAGLGIKNIGFITNEKSSYSTVTEDVKWKRRVYTLGSPVALKLGKVDKGSYLILGGEYQWLFHYKEKEFVNGEKRKYKEWMSDRVNQFIPTVIVGYGYKDKIAITFNYALDNMMNPNYSYVSGTTTIYPYKDMESVLFYISLISRERFKNIFEKEKKTYNLTAL